MEKVGKKPIVKQTPPYLRIIVIAVVFCIPLTLALVLHGTLFGLTPGAQKSDAVTAESVVRGDSQIINTSVIGEDITGYAGPVPVEIYLTKGVIDSVKPLPNSESPRFFSKLEKTGLMKAWDGKTLEEAASMEVDGVSGATYSSKALIGNVRAGVAYAEGLKASSSPDFGISAVGIVALLVILAGALVPLWVHNPTYRIVQQILNVAVLGFWAGTFLDYAMMIGFFASKPHLTLAFITTVLLLIVGFIFPAFGKPGHYCAWICPFGSLQELTGKVCKKKIKMSPSLIKGLDSFRQLLWCVLLLFLYTGWAAGWIDYEVFTAFIVTSASWIVIAVGGAFIVLSLFINRPFCRFVCPTGTLLKDL